MFLQNITSNNIVIFLIILVLIILIYQYDIYIVPHSSTLCKQDKKENFKETFQNLVTNMNNKAALSGSIIMTPLIDDFNINSVVGEQKQKVIMRVIKILAKTPTALSTENVKHVLEYFALIYNASESSQIFFSKIIASTKIKTFPYNTDYAKLIIYLIDSINNQYENCIPKPPAKIISTETSSCATQKTKYDPLHIYDNEPDTLLSDNNMKLTNNLNLPEVVTPPNTSNTIKPTTNLSGVTNSPINNQNLSRIVIPPNTNNIIKPVNNLPSITYNKNTITKNDNKSCKDCITGCIKPKQEDNKLIESFNVDNYEDFASF